jgi:hypothetical protein
MTKKCVPKYLPFFSIGHVAPAKAKSRYSPGFFYSKLLGPSENSAKMEETEEDMEVNNCC